MNRRHLLALFVAAASVWGTIYVCRNVLAYQPSEPLSCTIYNLTLTSANTQYSQAIGSCNYFSIQCQTAYDVRWSPITGKVATPTAPYATIKAAGAYNSPEKVAIIGGQTLYFASAQAGVVVEIITWSIP